MNVRPTVLLLGATGRTGRCVLDHLTRRGVAVRVIVRSPDKLPAHLRERPGLELTAAGITGLDDAAFEQHVRGADVVISCLGHTLSLRGVFGKPRDLVTGVVKRVHAAVQAIDAPHSTRLVLMSSVSVNGPRGLDTRRGAVERASVALLRGVLPPAKDNQSAADFLARKVGANDRRLEWVIVRPDALKGGEAGPYTVHDALVDSLFSPGETTMDAIGKFMAELATDDAAWTRWRGRFPVIVNERAPRLAHSAAA